MSFQGTKPGLAARLRKTLRRRRKPSSIAQTSDSFSEPPPTIPDAELPASDTNALPRQGGSLSTPDSVSTTPEHAVLTQAVTFQPGIASPPTMGASQQAWTAVKETFMRAKDASALRLPSLSQLLAVVPGLTSEFEEVEDAKASLSSTAQRLEELTAVISELSARFEYNREIRSRLETIDAYIRTRQKPLIETLETLSNDDYLKRAAAAKEVTRNIAKIVSDVHGDILLPLIKVVNSSREEDIIQKELCPVNMHPVFDGQDHGCMTGTRTAILARLLAWAEDPTAAPVFWLSGMAGIGKTAIAQTFCDLLNAKGIFTPSFFCSRRTSINDHQDATRIVPTLSSLMAQKYPMFMSGLLAELSSLRPGRPPLSLTIKEQFQLLLQSPLAFFSNEAVPLPAILVIDALDELKDRHLVGEFIDGLLSVAGSMPVKFLLTSRPEDQIRFRLPNRPSSLHNILRLHDVEDDVIKEDIRLYLRRKLYEISGKFRKDLSRESQEPWPPASQLERLVSLANNLFLYASTVTKYLAEEDPERRLQDLLNAQNTIATVSVDDTYSFILRTAFPPQKLEPWEKDNRNRCLATLICTRRPLSIQDMADLLDLNSADVRAAFRPLHSVVQVPTGPTDALSTFHTSFQEYLTIKERSGFEEWFVDVPRTHSDLASRCLGLMSGLHFNITQMRSSYLANMEDHRGATISMALSYSCLYGVEHLAPSQPRQADVVSYGECFMETFLYWLEVLSVIGQANQASSLLMQFIEVIDGQASFSRNDIRNFFVDGNTFIIRFQEPISLSPPHIYLSALPFTEPESQIARALRKLFPHTLKVKVPDTVHAARRQVPLLRLQGHTGSVLAVAFSNDSTRIVSSSEDGTIRVWDARTGKEVCQPLVGHTGSVVPVAFSHDSTRIVSGSGQTIRVWDARTGKEVCEPLEGHTDWITSFAFSHDSTRIVSGSVDGTIRVWDALTGRQVCEPLVCHTAGVRSVAFSHDSTSIVSGGWEDMAIRVWDAQTGKEVCEPLLGHTSTVTFVAFSHDSTSIVSGSSDGTIRVWDPWTGKKVCKRPMGHNGGDSSVTVAVLHDFTRIASGSLYTNTIRVWDAQTGKDVCEPLAGHTAWIRSVAFSPDSTRIVSGSDDETIRVWDALTGNRAGREVCGPLVRSTDGIMSVAFSHDSAHIVSGSGRTIRVWDARTGKEVCEPLLGHTNAVNSVAFSHDSTRIVSGWSNGTILVWDAETWTTVCKSHLGYTRAVTSVAFSHDSTYIVSGSQDMTIRVWDAWTGEEVCEPLLGHTSAVTSVAFSHDSTSIASGSSDETIRVWDARSGTEVCEPLRGHTSAVTSVAFSHDSTCIVSGSQDMSIRVWDAWTGEEVCEPLLGHTSAVTSVAFSHDSTCIVSGSQDMSIRVWDAWTGEEVCEPLLGHTSAVTSVAFSHDSTCIVSGSQDMTIRVWDAWTGEEVCEPLLGHTSAVTSVAFSHDSTCIIVSGSSDEMIRVWDAWTGEEVCDPLVGRTSWVSSVVFSHDSTCIVSGWSDGMIRVWNPWTGEEVCEPLLGHTSPVSSVAFSHDSTCIVSGSHDMIRVWDAWTGEEVCQPLLSHTCSVVAVAFSHDSTRIISGSEQTIRVWDARTGKEIRESLEGHTDWVTSVAFSHDSTQIVAGSFEGTIRVWDAWTGEEVCEPLVGHKGSVEAVAFSHDSTRIISGSEQTIRVWDARTGKEVCESLEGHTDLVRSVAFSHDSTQIVSGSFDGTIRVWDAKTVSFETTKTPTTVTDCNSPYFRVQRDGGFSGWAVSSSGERLFWVPEEFRAGLYTPRTMLVIGATPCPVDLSQFVYGEDWASCYVGPG